MTKWQKIIISKNPEHSLHLILNSLGLVRGRSEKRAHKDSIRIWSTPSIFYGGIYPLLEGEYFPQNAPLWALPKPPRGFRWGRAKLQELGELGLKWGTCLGHTYCTYEGEGDPLQGYEGITDMEDCLSEGYDADLELGLGFLRCIATDRLALVVTVRVDLPLQSYKRNGWGGSWAPTSRKGRRRLVEVAAAYRRGLTKAVMEGHTAWWEGESRKSFTTPRLIASEWALGHVSEEKKVVLRKFVKKKIFRWKEGWNCHDDRLGWMAKRNKKHATTLTWLGGNWKRCREEPFNCNIDGSCL